MRKRSMIAVSAACLIVVLGACGGTEPEQASPPSDAVSISGFLFKPETLRVASGTSVTWTNRDDIAHTVTAGTPEAPGRMFDSGDRTKGETFSHMFGTAGTFAYFCKNHNGMRGSIEVA